jgi:hypothetical protein
MFANGTVGNGGPYDGIVTLNSSAPFQFTRPVSANNFDAQNATEHETDEVIAFASNADASNLRTQDLFSWSSAGVRNIRSTGTRYFSINSGVTNIVNFNQNPSMDLGDWLTTACPQAHPYVQNAAGCRGQSSDIAATSPEGVNLDVIGYDLVTTTRAAVADFISIATCIQIMHCSTRLPIKQRSGICQDQRASQARTGQRFPEAGIWWLQVILTVMATRTMCFTMQPRARQRSGI